MTLHEESVKLCRRSLFDLAMWRDDVIREALDRVVGESAVIARKFGRIAEEMRRKAEEFEQ